MWIVSSVAGVYKPYGGTTPACMWQRIYYRGAIGCPSGMILPKQTHGPHAGGCKKPREAADPGAPPGLFFHSGSQSLEKKTEVAYCPAVQFLVPSKTQRHKNIQKQSLIQLRASVGPTYQRPMSQVALADDGPEQSYRIVWKTKSLGIWRVGDWGKLKHWLCRSGPVWGTLKHF